MLNFDAFELVDELLPGKHAFDMVWVDEWRGDRVRSRLLCASRGLEMICLRERQTRFSPSICWSKLRVARTLESLSSTFSVAFMLARTDEEIYVKVPSGIKSSRFWRLKGSSEWNKKTFKALARVLMRQARDKYALTTERHQSVYLQTVL